MRDTTPEITLDNILPMDKKDRYGEREKFLCSCEYVKGMDSVAGDFEVTDQAVYFRNLELMVSPTPLNLFIYRRCSRPSRFKASRGCTGGSTCYAIPLLRSSPRDADLSSSYSRLEK